LKAFHEPEFPNQEKAPERPDPQLVEGGFQEYEVDDVLDQRGSGRSVRYLVRWKGYGPEDDTWEPAENLANAKDMLRRFKARGRATKGGEYHVMRAITEEIRRSKSSEKETNNGTTSGDRTLADEQKMDRKDQLKLVHGPDRFEEGDEPVGLRVMGERDSGTWPDLTGKLCRCVMALIWWRVGADKAVTEHVVRALEEWLWRRGISIYTDQL
jgi:hypothetical protein